MAVTFLKSSNNNMNYNKVTLSRSLERILEEANLSGELKLCGRKLKDFPKIAGTYDLRDTVLADLSRNRFCELPDEITSFAFLERLLAFHNTIRSIPENVRGLHSLTYLDLRNNQLSVLPREICFLPLQVFLISNNRLVSLPDELGRMTELTELDVACNQITHLPARLSDLTNLRSICLRQNQLVYLPRELTCLKLVSLDISCNKIAQLPIELRLMTTLVDLELSDNPLTSPPASLCMRGLVHIFKYLENQVTKEEKSNKNGNTDNNGPFRRQMQTKHSNSFNENMKPKRQNFDSDYSLDDGLESRWFNRANSKFSKSESTTPTMSTFAINGTNNLFDQDQLDTKNNKMNSNYLNNNSADISPEDNTPDSFKTDEKLKSLGTIQTYKEYKEQLKQQRNQESSSIYRTKEVSTPDGNTSESPISSLKSQNSSPSIYSSNSNQNSPISPYHVVKFNGISTNQDVGKKSCDGNIKRSTSKITPSKTPAAYQTNGNAVNGNTVIAIETDCGYVKPNSPMKAVTEPTKAFTNINGTSTNNTGHTIKTQKNKTVSWNRDMPADKLSFTMRREFDKHKEEEELISQLRSILETKLKISLPEDISSALTDGVVLCHLANHVRPRSVGSIHVPSPAVPKLTMARCRRNVDNFLEACRKIGVDEELICSCVDIVPPDDDNDDTTHHVPNILALYQTISALIQLDCEFKKKQKPLKLGMDEYQPATNTNEIDEERRKIRQAPNTLDLSNMTRKRKYTSTKFHMMQATSNQMKGKDLTEIIEECEYDSDIGKFRCKTELFDNYNEDNDSEHKINLNNINDLNSPLKPTNKTIIETRNIIENDGISYEKNSENAIKQKIDYFESINNSEKSNNLCKIQNTDNKLPTILFSIFVLLMALLIFLTRN